MTGQGRRKSVDKDGANANIKIPSSSSTTSSASGSPSSKPERRKKVSHACLYCRRSHMTCDSGRPCQRCIKRKIAHLCIDDSKTLAKNISKSGIQKQHPEHHAHHLPSNSNPVQAIKQSNASTLQSSIISPVASPFIDRSNSYSSSADSDILNFNNGSSPLITTPTLGSIEKTNSGIVDSSNMCNFSQYQSNQVPDNNIINNNSIFPNSTAINPPAAASSFLNTFSQMAHFPPVFASEQLGDEFALLSDIAAYSNLEGLDSNNRDNMLSKTQYNSFNSNLDSDSTNGKFYNTSNLRNASNANITNNFITSIPGLSSNVNNKPDLFSLRDSTFPNSVLTATISDNGNVSPNIYDTQEQLKVSQDNKLLSPNVLEQTNPLSSSLISPNDSLYHNSFNRVSQAPLTSLISTNTEGTNQDLSPFSSEDVENDAALDPSLTAQERFLFTAADASVGVTNEQRMHSIIEAKYHAGLLRPHNYGFGYQRLHIFMEKNISAESRDRILRVMGTFRPAFRSIAQSLTDMDLVMVEETFERLLLEYDRLFSAMGIPACLWRRTGEIWKSNKEFANIVGLPVEELTNGKKCIWDFLHESSLISYWEKYGEIAFDPGQKAVLTTCIIKGKKYCFSFTIRRDRYNIPFLIAGNFLAVEPEKTNAAERINYSISNNLNEHERDHT